MFERFTAEARDTVVRAFDIARHHGHSHIGTGHILASLARGSDGTAAVLTEHGITTTTLDRLVTEIEADRATGTLTEQDAVALRSLGIDVTQIRDSVEKTFGKGALDRTSDTGPARRWWQGARDRRGPGGGASVSIPFTAEVTKSLELSLREAAGLGERSIATAHIALGVLSSGDAAVTQFLSELGVDSEALAGDLKVSRTS